jgi:hypothetical protein
MHEAVIIVDVSEIREGQADRVGEGMKELAKFAEAHEPRMAMYGVYFDESRGRVTVLQMHPDSPSAEFHLEAAGHLFPKFKDLLRLLRIDVYGAPTETLLGRLQGKAEMLGRAEVEVHDWRAGFAR